MTLPRGPCVVVCLAVLFIGSAHATVQGVFAHYMVGGMSSISQALTDVSDAQSLGLDAFALNIQHPDAWWTRASLAFLFEAASQIRFKLFFSMDMAAIPSPSVCLDVLTEYASHPAYYHHEGRPFLSTFRGGANPASSKEWQTLLQTVTPVPYFIPNFEDHPSAHAGIYPPSIFTTFPYIDGLMGWETAWPFPGTSHILATQQSSADAANIAVTRSLPPITTDPDETNDPPLTPKRKTYMLPLSTFQSKHSPEHGNWFRAGGLTLPRRVLEAVALQPDFVQLISWNDAGEGHYFGNVWQEALGDGMAEGSLLWDHRGWWAVLRSFVASLKGTADGSGGGRQGIYPVEGGEFAAVFWYRPLLKGVECGMDRAGLGKPDGWEDAEDMVNVVVLLERENVGVRIRVWSGGRVAAEFEGRPGMNMYQVDVGKGEQMVQLVADDGRVIAEGKGAVGVTDRIEDIGGICSFNYQVVEIV